MYKYGNDIYCPKKTIINNSTTMLNRVDTVKLHHSKNSKFSISSKIVFDYKKSMIYLTHTKNYRKKLQKSGTFWNKILKKWYFFARRRSRPFCELVVWFPCSETYHRVVVVQSVQQSSCYRRSHFLHLLINATSIHLLGLLL